MRIEHLAIDGSTVEVEAEAELNTGATATGWAISPALARTHPFSIHAAGYSSIVERAVRPGLGEVRIHSDDTYSVKGGKLRVAEVEIPTKTGPPRSLTVGAWEGETGCLTTSIVGRAKKKLVEVFDTLQFSTRKNGLAIDSPVTPLPRAPEVIKEIPGLGVLSIRPAIPTEIERVPRATGFQTAYGELFRYRAGSNAVLFVGRTTVVRMSPLGSPDCERLLKLARSLRVEWSARAAKCG